MSTLIRTATYLALALAALAATTTFTLRSRVEAARERAKDDAGAISLETILIAVALAGFAAVVTGLIAAAISKEGGKL